MHESHNSDRMFSSSADDDATTDSNADDAVADLAFHWWMRARRQEASQASGLSQ
jgi:primase-polymerase (primpol)-like protein